MAYRQATAHRCDFSRTPALSGTTTAARTIKAPAVARAQGVAAKLGALPPVLDALPRCGQQCRATGPGTVEGRARIAAALLIASVVALPAPFSPRHPPTPPHTPMPTPPT